MTKQPTNTPLTTKEKNTPDIKPIIRVKNKENAGQPFEQPIDAQKLTKEIIEAEAELRAMGNKPKSETEQPNTELLIVKTIQGLISAVNRELGELDEETQMLSCHRNSLVLKALEEIDLFQRTTLNELQEAFE